MKQNMVQMLNLILALPGLIGELVPRYDKMWKTFLLLREITLFLMAETIQKDSIPYLREVIADFLQNYVEHFNHHLTPKFHMLTHYPMIITKVGPVRHFSALRLEGKHRILKKLAVTSNNFKNICLTLSKRHQIAFAYRCLTNRGLFNDLVEDFGRSVPTTVGKIAGIDKAQLVRYFCNASIQVSVAKKISLNGVLFSEGSVIYLGPDGFYPRFFQIKTIIIYGSFIFFLGSVLQILRFERHLQAYIVSDKTPNAFHLKERSQMQSPWCFHVRTQMQTDRKFISLPSQLA